MKRAALALLLTSLAWAANSGLPVKYALAGASEVRITFDHAATNVKVTAEGVHGLKMSPASLTRASVKEGEVLKLPVDCPQDAPAPAAILVHLEGNFYGTKAAENRSLPVGAPTTVRPRTEEGKYKTVPVNVTR